MTGILESVAVQAVLALWNPEPTNGIERNLSIRSIIKIEKSNCPGSNSKPFFHQVVLHKSIDGVYSGKQGLATNMYIDDYARTNGMLFDEPTTKLEKTTLGKFKVVVKRTFTGKFGTGEAFWIYDLDRGFQGGNYTYKLYLDKTDKYAAFSCSSYGTMNNRKY